MRLLYIVCSIILITACGSGSGKGTSAAPPAKPVPEQPDSGEPPTQTPGYPNAQIIIPVVVHVLQHPDSAESRIKDSKVHSQITALNEAFNRSNADLSKVPALFQPLIADMQIEFRLAETDPDGNASNGITRTDYDPGKTPADYHLGYRYAHYSEFGGIDPWPRDQYLNIWVVDARRRDGRIAFAGRATFPGEPPEEDGILVSTHAFGTEPPLSAIDGVTLGRTAVHEVGHWLGLYHLAGTAESCNVDDGIDDTPLAETNYHGNPTHPSSSCNSVDMFMNYMAKPHDASMLMFTKGQKDLAWQALNDGGDRHSLLKNHRDRLAAQATDTGGTD